MNPIVRTKLIKAGIRNLKEFGYPQVNETNILTDHLYSAFFDRMLEDHTGQGKAEANELRKEIAKNQEAK
jgi:hypothetical protein